MNERKKKDYVFDKVMAKKIDDAAWKKLVDDTIAKMMFIATSLGIVSEIDKELAQIAKVFKRELAIETDCKGLS